jgi:hypothetical protein
METLSYAKAKEHNETHSNDKVSTTVKIKILWMYSTADMVS